MSARDLGLFVAIGAAIGISLAVLGSPRWRQEPCESRYELCAAQLIRSGATIADLSRQMREHCR